MADSLPFEIREAIIQTAGKAFWYRDPLRTFLIHAGVPADLYARYAHEPKFKIMRHILSELDTMGDNGSLIQRKILTELCKLRNLPDPAVPDRDVALAALRSVKELAAAQKIDIEADNSVAQQRKLDSEKLKRVRQERASVLERLRRQFGDMAVGVHDPQSRGYGLEDLLQELFLLHEIDYRPPFKTSSDQVDGHFQFGAFDYLVEARWREKPPTELDISSFRRKIEKRISSTRGLFVSVTGFRPEVISESFKGRQVELILMDGNDLALILEGHVSLTDALDMKIQKAAQEGSIFFPLRNRF